MKRTTKNQTGGELSDEDVLNTVTSRNNDNEAVGNGDYGSDHESETSGVRHWASNLLGKSVSSLSGLR